MAPETWALSLTRRFTFLKVCQRKWPKLELLIFLLFLFWLESFDFFQRSIGSDSQGRVTAANNQRQLAGVNRKPHNYLPLHVNTNKSKELLHPSTSAPTTPAITKEIKKQSPGIRVTLTPMVPAKESSRLSRGATERGPSMQREHERRKMVLDSSQVIFWGY